eukprot:4216687-Amphidinium_carterae.1
MCTSLYNVECVGVLVHTAACAGSKWSLLRRLIAVACAYFSRHTTHSNAPQFSAQKPSDQ